MWLIEVSPCWWCWRCVVAFMKVWWLCGSETGYWKEMSPRACLGPFHTIVPQAINERVCSAFIVRGCRRRSPGAGADGHALLHAPRAGRLE